MHPGPDSQNYNGAVNTFVNVEIIKNIIFSFLKPCMWIIATLNYPKTNQSWRPSFLAPFTSQSSSSSESSSPHEWRSSVWYTRRRAERRLLRRRGGGGRGYCIEPISARIIMKLSYIYAIDAYIFMYIYMCVSVYVYMYMQYMKRERETEI